MAVLSTDIYDDRFSPSEKKVSGCRTGNDGQAKPRVECHHDQHQEVGDGQLKEQNCDLILLLDFNMLRFVWGRGGGIGVKLKLLK